MTNNNKTNNFIERAKSVHGNKYDYSNVNYISNKINTNESIIRLNENELKRIIKECIREYIIGQKETSD